MHHETKVDSNSRTISSQKWNANQELTTEEKLHQTGTNDASKLTCAHLVETPLESSPMLASLIRRRPHRRLSLEFSVLTCFNSSCMRQDRLRCRRWPQRLLEGHRARERDRSNGFRRIADAEPRVAMIGSAKLRFLDRKLCKSSEFGVQFCGNVTRADTAQHFAKTTVFGSIATAYTTCKIHQPSSVA